MDCGYDAKIEVFGGVESIDGNGAGVAWAMAERKKSPAAAGAVLGGGRLLAFYNQQGVFLKLVKQSEA